MNLAGVDLNLLVALDALLKERNVTRAAKHVGLTQPAMSNALARLRDLLGDPVLVRAPGGMRPTPRAESLATPLADALRQIRDAVLAPTSFDPRTAQQTFNVAAQDYELLVLVPDLVDRLAREAPGVRLHFTSPKGPLPVEDLAQGSVDVVLGIRREEHAGLFHLPLFEERFLCAVADRDDMPKKGLTLERYAALEHLLISPYGGMSGMVDEALRAHGLRRTVKIAVPQFAIAPLVLVRSSYILTLPARAAHAFEEHLPIRLLKPPLEIPPFTEMMFWHERSHRDPAHRWLRETIAAVAAGKR